MNFRLAVIVSLLLFVADSPGADWPQWRGRHRNGISSERILTNWPAEGPKVLWRASVGTGFSSAAISNGRVCTMGNANDRDTVWCFDAPTGKLLWKHAYDAPLGPQYYEGGPGSTPTIYGNHFYTISKWGQVLCLEATNGAVRWERDLRQEGIAPNRWGFAGSPLIWGPLGHSLLILNAGAGGTALDILTGRTVWSNGTNATGYASPVLFKSGDKEAVLIFAAKNLIAVEPATGRELWRLPWETGWDTNNPDPLVYDGSVFISSYSRGCALLSIRDNQPVEVYDKPVLHNHLSPGVVVGEYLFSGSGEAKKETDFRCIHLPTGELKWVQKDLPTASVICAGGKLLVLTEKGELLLADPSPNGFKPLARAQVLGGLCWTPPALANGLLYVRNAKGDLVCLDLRP